MTVRFINRVVPLAHEATDKRIKETGGSVRARSCAAAHLIGVEPSGGRRDQHDTTSRILTMPGTRTSETATRTTGTRTTSFRPGSSANRYARHHADFSFEELTLAYFKCREHKRNSASAIAFEMRQERNLRDLYDELHAGSYRPGRSICFVITRPNPREVWAAEFRDRIVHHLLYNRIGPAIEARFIADSCACIPGRGTLYAAQRLEAKARSVTQNWSHPASYLKLDLANFFVSIDKAILSSLLERHIGAGWWLDLANLVLWHDPREDFELRGDPALLERVPPHKRLALQPAHLGLPIGNLSSQFFANVYLNELDQFAKHQLGARHYIRYVDDFVLLHHDARWLADAHRQIRAWLPENLHAHLNDSKTILQPVARGIDFVGQVIKPWRRELRRRTVAAALQRIDQVSAAESLPTINSYFGLARQATASHYDRARIANVARRRGHSVKADFTKAYRRASA
ncbi:MAG: RNA-directed DNA polymerase [Betaproteobacteria bacterium]|nr:RNA-directed DNA polymerase [Betaproteobacteria bacterium]